MPDDDGDDGQAAQPVDQDEAPPAASAVTQLTVPVHTQHLLYRYTLFYTAASVHSTAKQLLQIIHTSLAHRKSLRGGFQLKCLC